MRLIKGYFSQQDIDQHMMFKSMQLRVDRSHSVQGFNDILYTVTAYLVPVHCDCCQGKRRDMQGAILCKATHMTHAFPEHPGTVHKASLWREPGNIHNAKTI